MADLWFSRHGADEPPSHITRVRDGEGDIAGRTPEACEYCGTGDASIWRWEHNGNSDCWLDIDGYGPWVEVRP